MRVSLHPSNNKGQTVVVGSVVGVQSRLDAYYALASFELDLFLLSPVERADLKNAGSIFAVKLYASNHVLLFVADYNFRNNGVWRLKLDNLLV